VSDRGASIRIPIGSVERGWKGWLEDRRPNSAADPYKVAARIVKTVKSAEIDLSSEAEFSKKGMQMA
jgi:glutamine synthetase